MKALFRPSNAFKVAPSGWLERAYRRYRFRQAYSRLTLVPVLDAEQGRMVAELRREGTLILNGYLSAETVKEMQRELRQELDALRFETPCLAQSRIDPHKHRALIDDYL